MERAFSKLPLFVAYYRRAYPRQELKQDLAAGRLGTIQSVSSAPGSVEPPRAGDWRLDAEKAVVVGSLWLARVGSIDFLLGPPSARASARGSGEVETRSRCTSASENRWHGDVEFRGVGGRGSAHNIRFEARAQPR